MKITGKTFLIASPVFVFLIAGIIWYLISYQAVGFLSGFAILIFFIFLVFWKSFLLLRKSGELIGIKNKKQIILISLIFALGFGELIWSVSFLPFSFFILSGIIAIIFGTVLDIYREYFKQSAIDSLKIKKIFARDISLGAISIIIFIIISPWFPPKTY